jgi:hypothetical protein
MRAARGAHFRYSNLGFQTLGYALERIDGVSYPAIIQRRSFNRLGMRSSAAAIDDRIRARLPVSYSRWPHSGDYVEEPWFEYTAADGSIVSTAEDMAAYARVILNRGAAPQGRLLSDRAFERLTTPALDGYAYGLNVRSSDGDTEILHGGAIAGFGSQLLVRMNDGFGVVMLSSAGGDTAMGWWIVDAVKAAVRNQPVSEFKPAAPPPAADWAGTFTGKDGRTLEFAVDPTDGSRLTLKRGIQTAALTRVGPNAFREADGDPTASPYAFERRDGKVVEVARGSDWYTRGAYSAPASFDVPAEFATFAGRYKNHNPEGGPLRVFVRGASLMIGRRRGRRRAAARARGSVDVPSRVARLQIPSATCSIRSSTAMRCACWSRGCRCIASMSETNNRIRRPDVSCHQPDYRTSGVTRTPHVRLPR